MLLPLARGCPAAALRIWTAPDTDQAPIELCGDKPAGEVWHYISRYVDFNSLIQVHPKYLAISWKFHCISSGQNARISFITTDKTIGAQV